MIPVSSRSNLYVTLTVVSGRKDFMSVQAIICFLYIVVVCLFYLLIQSCIFHSFAQVLLSVYFFFIANDCVPIEGYFFTVITKCNSGTFWEIFLTSKKVGELVVVVARRGTKARDRGCFSLLCFTSVCCVLPRLNAAQGWLRCWILWIE